MFGIKKEIKTTKPLLRDNQINTCVSMLFHLTNKGEGFEGMFQHDLESFENFFNKRVWTRNLGEDNNIFPTSIFGYDDTFIENKMTDLKGKLEKCVRGDTDAEAYLFEFARGLLKAMHVKGEELAGHIEQFHNTSKTLAKLLLAPEANAQQQILGLTQQRPPLLITNGDVSGDGKSWVARTQQPNASATPSVSS